MSAPLVVNTQDGTCWVRRALTREGSGMYALAGSVAGAPDEVLATLAELAEHGIAGMADVLPMPVGPVPRSELDQVRDDVVGACLARWEAEQETARLFLAWGSARMRARRKNEALKKLRARVAELDALELGDLDGRRSACCGKPGHLTWLREADDTRACPWCVMELQSDSLVARTHQLAHYQEIERNFWGNQRVDESRAAVANLRIVELNAERDALQARVVELEAGRLPYAELAKRERAADKLAALIAPSPTVEDPHDGPLAHKYRIPRDLPEPGGVS